MDNTSEIDAIIDQLTADAVDNNNIINKKQKSDQVNLNDDNVNEFVYNKTAEVISSGLEAINTLKDSVMTGQDPKEISALAQLINATSKAIDGLNKINLQNKQHKNNIEVAKLENESLKKLQTNTTTNVVAIATREDVMKRLFDKPNKTEKIDLIEDSIVENE